MRIQFDFAKGDEWLAVKVLQFVHEQLSERQTQDKPREMVKDAALTVNTIRVLRGHGFEYVDQLEKIGDFALLQLPAVGRKMLNEIRDVCGVSKRVAKGDTDRPEQ